MRIRNERLHVGQLQAAQEAKRFNVVCCGRRWGKTTLGEFLSATSRRGAVHGTRVAWIAPTYDLLNEAYGRLDYQLTDVAERSVRSPKPHIQLLTGGRIDFYSAGGQSSVRGNEFDLALVDEAAYIPNLKDFILKDLMPTLMDRGGDLWMLSTPNGHDDFYEFWKRGGEHENWAKFKFKTWDRPSFPDVEKQAILSDPELPETVILQEYEAEFIEDLGGDIKRSMIVYWDAEPTLSQQSIGVDLAISKKATADYTAIGAVGLDKDQMAYALDVQRRRANFAEALEFIENFAADYPKGTPVVVEAVAYQQAAVEELQRHTTLNVREIKPTNDKVTRFQPVAARIQKGQMRFNPNISPEFIRELLAFPGGKHDDMRDAVSHAFYGLRREKRIIKAF